MTIAPVAGAPKTGFRRESSGKSIAGPDNFADNLNCLLAIGAADVPVRHQTDSARVHRSGQDFSLIEVFYALQRGESGPANVEYYDVRLNLCRIHFNAWNLA